MPRIGAHVFNLRDFVKETTQTSGTGAYQLDGVSLPEEGHQSFLTAVGDGQKTLYAVKRGSTWEKAIGTVSAGAPVTLSRDLILGTSADDSLGADAINWPTTDAKDIYIGSPADLLNLIDPSILAFLDTANVFTAVQTIDVNADDIDVLIGRNAAGTEVWRLRINSSGNGVLVLRNSEAETKVTLSCGTDNGMIELIGADDNPTVQLDGNGVHALQGTVRQDGNKVVCAPNIFESSEQTITSGTLTSVAHSLGGVPKQAWGVLRCKTTDAGFAVGDEIETFAYRSVSADTEEGVLVGADATNVFFTVGSSGIRLWNKASGQNASLTNANWRVVLRAWI